MSGSDGVRHYCAVTYISPARKRGDYTVSIRSGDVHRDLGLSSQLPMVCAALGTETFEQENRLRRLAVTGPLNGANTLFTFIILDNWK